MIFRSAVDGWLLAGIVASTLGCLAAGAVAMAAAPAGQAPVVGVFLLLLAAFPLWLLTSTYYVLTDTELHVRSGPFRWRIPLAEIRVVERTRDARSSPALSLDRLRLGYGRRSLLISPRDLDGFLRALHARGVRPSAQ